LAIVLTLIPGCGHLHDRQRYLGWGLLAGWSVMLLLALIMLGTEWHNLFWFIAIFIHAYAFLHLLVMSVYNQTWLVTQSAAWVVFLFWLEDVCFTFQPGSWARVSTQFSQSRISCPIPWFIPMMYCYMKAPCFGPTNSAMVTGSVYRIERSTFGHTIVASGLNIDRIVGIPGDHVKVRQREHPREWNPPSTRTGSPLHTADQ
jgi:hypothetical protein